MDSSLKGKVIIEKTPNSIVVGITDFSQMGLESDEYITYEGVEYQRGLLSIVPNNMTSYVCSVREYTKVKIG